MDDFFTLDTEQQRGYFEQASSKLGLEAASIEKDFWVCWVLRELFALPDIGATHTFKGGTSLSKGWKLIERFSEDIDVVIDRDFLGFGDERAPDATGISNKERDRRLDELRVTCQKHIREVLAPALESRFSERVPAEIEWTLTADPSDDDLQTLLFAYPPVATERPYLRPVVKIELGARSDTEPSAMPEIQSYLAEAFPGEMKRPTFQVRTVAPQRTFWEKAMLLHEEGFRAATEGPKARLARHYYDLWCLIRAGVAADAAADRDLFRRVAAHRGVFFRRNKQAHESLRPGSLKLLPKPELRTAWKTDYDAMRDTMFFREPPRFDEIMQVVGDFEREFNASAAKEG